MNLLLDYSTVPLGSISVLREKLLLLTTQSLAVEKSSVSRHLKHTLIKFLFFNIQCDLQEERHPIYRYEYIREEERKGRVVNYYKLLETRSNEST